MRKQGGGSKGGKGDNFGQRWWRGKIRGGVNGEVCGVREALICDTAEW